MEVLLKKLDKGIEGNDKFTFKVNDVSIACLLYIKEINVNIESVNSFISPDGLDEDTKELYNAFINLSFSMYDRIKNVCSEEIAQYVLPLATCVNTEITVTADELSYLESMCYSHEELRELINHILTIKGVE